MDEQMKYVILRWERDYYQKNFHLLTAKSNCMHIEELHCNCITGIMVNYAGYMIKNIFKEECKANFIVENKIQYIKIRYNGIDIFPIRLENSENTKYYFESRICRKSESEEQAYLPFSQYNNMDDIIKEIDQYNQNIMNTLFSKNIYNFEFCIRFLQALRVKSLEKSNKAFLAMFLFVFPNKTLKLIHEVIESKMDISLLRKLVVFFNEYLDFLKRIHNSKFGFLYNFAISFEQLSEINIAELIEEAIGEDLKSLILNSLQSAYINNIIEIKQHRRGFQLILKSIQNAYNVADMKEIEEFKMKLNDLRDILV